MFLTFSVVWTTSKAHFDPAVIGFLDDRLADLGCNESFRRKPESPKISIEPICVGYVDLGGLEAANTRLC